MFQNYQKVGIGEILMAQIIFLGVSNVTKMVSVIIQEKTNILLCRQFSFHVSLIYYPHTYRYQRIHYLTSIPHIRILSTCTVSFNISLQLATIVERQLSFEKLFELFYQRAQKLRFEKNDKRKAVKSQIFLAVECLKCFV